MHPRKSTLDAEGQRIIRDALKVATVQECQRAIIGCEASDFHMKRGRYAQRPGPKHNALSKILKGKRSGRTTREQIDLFLEIADRAGAASGGVPSADPAKVSQAKRDVLTAWEFPGDDHSVRRGEEAKRWLEIHGWQVEHNEDGRPRFTWKGDA
jgi:hypothetical protein